MTDQPGGIPAECPADLGDLAAWLVWRYEPNDNPGGKPRKMPYYASGGRRTGQHGTNQDMSQLVTFKEACAAATRRKMSGVGLAMLPAFGICALDFDNCIDEAGDIHPDVLPLLAGTYSEVSPSGKGVRAFFTGDLGNRKDHGEPFGFETFSTKGFVTFTGDALPFAGEVAPVGQTVRDYCTSRFGKARVVDQTPPPHHAPTQADLDAIREALAKLDPGMGYHDWLKVGMAIHHGTSGEGFDLWDTWSQPAANYTTREFNWDRWRSFGKGGGPAVTIRSLLHLAGMSGSGPASAEEFEDEASREETPDHLPGGAYRFESYQELKAHPRPTWIIKGVLPKADLGVIYGASGSGKTFMATDMVAAIARGVPWRGHKVAQSRVAYVAAEAAGGFRNRLEAYVMHNKLEDIAIITLRAAPNLMDKSEAKRVARGILNAGGADLVVVDTFAQVMPGDENSGEDVGKALKCCRVIREMTGAMVILVHHSGKDASKGARGHSSLKAAADVEMEVTRGIAGRVLRLSKQKDGEDGKEWGFSLEVVQLGLDDDMEPITSCVVVEAEIKRAGPMRQLGPVERIVNDVVQEFAIAQTSGIEVKAVIEEAANRMAGPEDGKRDTRKTRAQRALKSLCEGDDAPYFEEDGCLSVC